MLFVSAARELRKSGVPLVLEILVDADRRCVIAFHGGSLQSHKEALFRRTRTLFVKCYLFEHRRLLVQPAGSKLPAVLGFRNLVHGGQALSPEIFGLRI